MNPEAREELSRIIAIGADGLTPEEKKFLFARRSYLNKGQKEEFKSVIHEVDAEVKANAEAAVKEA